MSSLKFQRYYQLVIQGATRTWTISYPFTMRFEVSRNILASANTGRLTLYNLPPEVRSDLFIDRMSSLQYRACRLKAGHINIASYQPGALPPSIISGAGPTSFPAGALIKDIFNGNAKECWSERRGSDWVTTIEAFDGGLAIYSPKSNVSVTLDAPWTGIQALQAIVGKMQSVSLGKVGSGVLIPGSTTRGFSASGDAWTAVQDLVKTSKQTVQNNELSAYAYIDNEVVNVAMPTDVLYPQQVVIEGAIPPSQASSSFTYPNLNSGIIGVPKRQSGIVEVSLLLAPDVKVGQQANLHVLIVSRRGLSTGFDWNGTYQVVGIRHSGTISAAFDGGAMTVLSLWDPSKYLSTATLLAGAAV